MKQTKLVAAPGGRRVVPPRAFRRFAAVRTPSQLIPGVGPTARRAAMKRLSGVALLAASIAGLSCISRAPAPFLAVPGSRHAETRDQAVCELIARGHYTVASPRYEQKVPSGGCRVRGLFDDTTSPSGTTVALLDPDFTDPELPARPDVGVLVIFDSTGRMVPVFEAANYLKGSDGVVKYRSDGALAVVHQFGYTGDPDWSVEALHVVPTTTVQTPILSVLLGAPHSRWARSGEREWTWRVQDADGDGNLEFDIGPAERDGAMDRKATYRYSSASNRYEGPGGSLAGDFYLVQPPQAECNWNIAAQFA